MRTQMMLRVPVAVSPPAAGTELTLDAALMRVVVGTPSLPYDVNANRWTATSTGGDWLFALSPPKQLGKLKPLRITIAADVSAPRHELTLQRGQHQETGVAMNQAGPVVAHWKQPVGSRPASFDCEPADYDADGRVWLRLRVEASTQGATDSVSTPWQIHRFSVTYRAAVLAPGSD